MYYTEAPLHRTLVTTMQRDRQDKTRTTDISAASQILKLTTWKWCEVHQRRSSHNIVNELYIVMPLKMRAGKEKNIFQYLM